MLHNYQFFCKIPLKFVQEIWSYCIFIKLTIFWCSQSCLCFLNISTKYDNLSKLICDMKQKMELCNQQEKLELLTLVPESLSNRKASKEFQVTRNLMAKEKHLESKHGICAIPRPQIWLIIPNDVEEKIVSFYRINTVSKSLPW